MNINVRNSFIKSTVVFAIIAVALVAGIALETPVAGATQQGFPLYSWGSANTGRLGRVVDAANPSTRPARVVNEQNVESENWVMSSSSAGGSWAINNNGQLFAWGGAWTAASMGQNGVQPPAAFLDGNNIIRPMRVGTESNWVQVIAEASFVVLLNSNGEIYRLGGGGVFYPSVAVPTRIAGGSSNFTYMSGAPGLVFAVNEDGEIWVAGTNNDGIHADGTRTGYSRTLIKVENTNDNWVRVDGSAAAVLATNENGEIYAWGNNGSGITGQGTTSGHTLTPTRIGTASDWVAIRVGAAAVVALNEDGEIYSWGNNFNGQTGQGIDTGHTLAPTRVGTASDWVSVGGSSQTKFALNQAGELWGWGGNGNGQLGIGTINAWGVHVPTFVVQTYGRTNISRGAGGTHTMMLIRTTPAEGNLALTKDLQKPMGTTTPNLTFSFTFTPHSFNDNTANLTPLPTIPTRTVTIDSSNTSYPNAPSAGITTTSNSVDVLEGIEFNQAGVYAWTIAEVQSASGIGANSNVVFSQATYRLRVYVAQEAGAGGDFYIYTSTIHRLTNTDGSTVTPPYKTPTLAFTNIYTRTRPADALAISKTVTGQFADATTPFSFEVTLTRTAFCTPTTNFTGRIMQGNSQVGASIPFTSGTTQTVTLLHNQRLVFDSLMVGTEFSVTELASPEFIASVELHVDGTSINVAPNTTPNTALPIGEHRVGTQSNTAAFTNNHNFIPPTGLSIADTSSTIPLFLAVIATLAFITLKARRRVEELPTRI